MNYPWWDFFDNLVTSAHILHIHITIYACKQTQQKNSPAHWYTLSVKNLEYKPLVLKWSDGQIYFNTLLNTCYMSNMNLTYGKTTIIIIWSSYYKIQIKIKRGMMSPTYKHHLPHWVTKQNIRGKTKQNLLISITIILGNLWVHNHNKNIMIKLTGMMRTRTWVCNLLHPI